MHQPNIKQQQAKVAPSHAYNIACCCCKMLIPARHTPAKVVAHYNESLLLPVANLKATTEAEHRALCCPLLLSLLLTAAPAALR
jgi:hypothetical protein